MQIFAGKTKIILIHQKCLIIIHQNFTILQETVKSEVKQFTDNSYHQ